MLLEGSCHCGAVSYTVTAHEAVPYMRCYCSICRKTAGTGGYAINLGADHRTLKVRGREHLSIYQARLEDGHVLTDGGRVLCAVGLGESVSAAQTNAYDIAAAIHWPGMQYRRDIGYRAVARERGG